MSLITNVCYLAGVFDVRGFIKLHKPTYHYAIYFNVYQTEIKLWKKIMNIIKSLPCHCKLYHSNKRKEYQLWIGRKNNIMFFIEMILPYSNRKKELIEFYDFLKSRRKEKKW
jgi:hypothetical protein